MDGRPAQELDEIELRLREELPQVSAAARFGKASAQTFETVSSWNLEKETNQFVQPFRAEDTDFTMHAMEGNFDHLQQVLAFRRAQAKANRSCVLQRKQAEDGTDWENDVANDTIPDPVRWDSWSSSDWQIFLHRCRADAQTRKIQLQVRVTDTSIRQLQASISSCRIKKPSDWQPLARFVFHLLGQHRCLVHDVADLEDIEQIFQARYQAGQLSDSSQNQPGQNENGQNGQNGPENENGPNGQNGQNGPAGNDINGPLSSKGDVGRHVALADLSNLPRTSSACGKA